MVEMIKNFGDYVRNNKGGIIVVAVTLMTSAIAYKCGMYQATKRAFTGLLLAGEDGITTTGMSRDGTTRTVNFRAKVIK